MFISSICSIHPHSCSFHLGGPSAGERARTPLRRCSRGVPRPSAGRPRPGSVSRTDRRGWCRCRVLRRSKSPPRCPTPSRPRRGDADRRVDLEVVPVFDVLKRVVARQDRDVAVGLRGEILELTVDLVEALVVGGGVLRVGFGVVGIDLGETVRDRLDDVLGDDRIDPDVWVVKLRRVGFGEPRRLRPSCCRHWYPRVPPRPQRVRRRLAFARRRARETRRDRRGTRSRGRPRSRRR